MLKNLFFLFIFAFSFQGFAQLQNPSFEQWDAGDPLYWSTSEFYNPGTAIQSTDSHSGNFALNIKVVTDSSGAPVAPYAINTFPLTTMPQVLTFWVKGTLASNNNVSASFTLAEIDTSTNVLAYGDQTFTTTSNVYQYKFVNILPLSGPSLLGIATIYFAINAPVGSTLNVNSSLIIDDLYLGVDNTGILNYKSSENVIEEVYPNPSEDLAYVIFNMAQFGHVSVAIYDLMGNKVLDVLDENLAEGKYKAEINAAVLKQGIYLCKLNLNHLEYCSKLIKK